MGGENKTNYEQGDVDRHLLGNLEPGLFEAEDRAAVERGGDLKYSIVIMKTAADVSHSYPFLNDHNPSNHIITPQDLCGDEIAYLVKKGEKQRVYS